MMRFVLKMIHFCIKNDEPPAPGAERRPSTIERRSSVYDKNVLHFLVKNLHFLVKNLHFLLKNLHFLLENLQFLSKNLDVYIKLTLNAVLVRLSGVVTGGRSSKVCSIWLLPNAKFIIFNTKSIIFSRTCIILIQIPSILVQNPSFKSACSICLLPFLHATTARASFAALTPCLTSSYNLSGFSGKSMKNQ